MSDPTALPPPSEIADEEAGMSVVVEEDSEETEFPDREHLDPEHLDSEPLDPEPLDPVRPDYAVDSESAVSWRKNLESIDFFVVNNMH